VSQLPDKDANSDHYRITASGTGEYAG